jgi:HK97 family phage prohead protease
MTTPTIVAPVCATPEAVTRDYAGRKAAGALLPGETPPAAVYRALLGMEADEEGEGKPAREPGRYPFVMSVGTADGAGDVVEQSWKLDRFMANPVAFFNHRSWGLPIGRWERVRVEGGVLKGDFVPTDASDEGRTIRAMLDEKTLRAASVGFIPGKATDRSKYPVDHPLYAERGYVFSENNLLECSIVGVPMHPEATMEGKGAAAPAAEPAPVAEGKAAPPPDDGPDFDLNALDRAFAAFFPVTVS